MPFVARCYRCGHIEEATTRWMIDLSMEEHDRESHGSHDSELWTVMVISNAEYSMFLRLSKSPAFWNSIRTKAHKIPRFSG